MADEPVLETVQDETVTSILIDLVQAEPMIWNMSSEEYSKTKTKGKDSRWKSIAEQLKIDVKIAKSTWKNLRTVYKRELKKCVPLASGSGGLPDREGESLYTGTWSHFEKMRFLSNIMMPRDTTGNLDGRATPLTPHIEINGTSAQETPPSQVHRNEHEEFVDQLIIAEEGIEFHPPASSDSSNTDSAKRRRTSMQRALDLEEKKIKVFQDRELNRASENDEHMLFLKSLYPSMKKAEDVLSLRLEIMTVVEDFLKTEELARLQRE